MCVEAEGDFHIDGMGGGGGGRCPNDSVVDPGEGGWRTAAYTQSLDRTKNEKRERERKKAKYNNKSVQFSDNKCRP